MSSVTMNQIAEVAGVSRATVSFVLNDRARTNGSISPDTRQRVLEIARELGYRPNRTARALVTGRSHLIGLCVRDLGLPHYANVIRRTESCIRRSPFHLLVSRWENDMEAEDERVLEGIFPWPLDGVLALEADEILTRHWAVKQQWPAPIVSMGGTNYHLDNLDSVGIDLAAGVTQALAHLIEIGCKHIAFVSHSDEANLQDRRARAYLKFMQKNHREAEFVTLSNQERAVAHHEFKEYTAHQGCPDGLLCINDEVAMGVYRALCDLQIKVPTDVALIGCDGIADTLYLECPLTTIVQPVEQMCRIAWEMLQQRIDNPDQEFQHQLLVPQLDVRDSSQYFGGNRNEKRV